MAEEVSSDNYVVLCSTVKPPYYDRVGLAECAVVSKCIDVSRCVFWRAVARLY
ncbi:hypothetical protein AOQ84DRAFT_353773 [Glonium stellatum]|uniref:Uncharacterized protein n=1 Tax=Glonium stellatum TaxID=574774 RepID=A0A8E2JUB7_9PEZI|nr:hypothetical protein AOQ84DRAFT_353773 [Glonium stellatum]